MSVVAASATSSASPSAAAKASRIFSLISRVRDLPLPRQRAIASVVGSCVADAASRPIHWLYDQAKLDATVGDADPAFWPTSLSPFYTLPTGRNSCYNDIGTVTSRTLPSYKSTSLADEGILDVSRYTANMLELFGPGTEYADAYRRRTEAYDPAKRYDEREPVPGPWQQGSVTVFLEAITQGLAPTGNPDSKETDGLVSALPLIARMSTTNTLPEQLHEVKRLASLLSSNPLAMIHTQCAGAILRNIIREGAAAATPEAMLKSISEVPGSSDSVEAELREIIDAPDSESHTKLVAQWGRPCANPGSFMGAIHATLRADGFAAGIRLVIKAGGCNCSRANLAGACLGAKYGFDIDGDTPSGIPLEWMVKTDKVEEVLGLALERL